MEPQKIQVAFLGLGKMGSAIAKKLLQANCELTVYNRSAEKMVPLINAGAKSAASPSEAVMNADVIVTSLLDDAAILEMVAGKDGFLTSLKAGAIHISTSTILPVTAKKLTQLHDDHGAIYLGGNVLGVPSAVESGQATSIVAGPSLAVDFCTPLFEAYSARIINVGEESYKANVMKICTNYLLITAIEAMGELYTYAEKSSLDTEFLHEFFHSVFANKAFLLYADKIKARNFDEVNFTIEGGLKDINLFQEAFADVGVVPEVASLVKNKFIAALANGLQEKDWSAVTEVTRMQAGLK